MSHYHSCSRAVSVLGSQPKGLGLNSQLGLPELQFSARLHSNKQYNLVLTDCSTSAYSKFTKLDCMSGRSYQTFISDYSAFDTIVQDGRIVTLRTDYFVTVGSNTCPDYPDDDQNPIEQPSLPCTLADQTTLRFQCARRNRLGARHSRIGL